MRVKIHVHKILQKYTNGLTTYECEAKDFTDVVNALKGVFPKFNNYFSLVLSGSAGENLAFLDKNKALVNKYHYEIGTLRKNHKEIYMVPVVYGSGKTGKMLAIIAIIAIAAYAIGAAGGLSALFSQGAGGVGATAPGFFASFFTPQKLFGMVFRLIISQIISSLNKPPKRPEASFDAPARRNNNLFEGLVNTTAPGTNIQLIYGQSRIAGQLISGFVETTEHGKDDDPKVSERFN